MRHSGQGVGVSVTELDIFGDRLCFTYCHARGIPPTSPFLCDGDTSQGGDAVTRVFNGERGLEGFVNVAGFR